MTLPRGSVGGNGGWTHGSPAMGSPPSLRAPMVPPVLLAAPGSWVVVLAVDGEVYLSCSILESLVGGDVVSHNEAMSILRRAEGYCLHKALSAKDDEVVQLYLDAADYLNRLWRELWWEAKYAQNAPQAHLRGPFGGNHDYE